MSASATQGGHNYYGNRRTSADGPRDVRDEGCWGQHAFLEPISQCVPRYTATRIVITGSIASSATRRYLSYSETDFEGFRPAGATPCTDGCEIWHEGDDRRSPPCQILPPSVQRYGYRTPKTEIFTEI